MPKLPETNKVILIKDTRRLLKLLRDLRIGAAKVDIPEWNYFPELMITKQFMERITSFDDDQEDSDD